MNRLIRNLAIANVILFSFVIPFTVVYGYVRGQITRTTDLAIVTAAENDERIDMVLAAASSTRALARANAAKHEASLALASWSSSLDKISLTMAQSVLPLVAQCESGNDPKAKSDISSAKGWLQILDGTWEAFQCTGNVLNKQDNYACGLKIATISGLHHWDPSRACWSKLITRSQTQFATR